MILKENKGKFGVYRFINKENGKSYIGSAVNFSRRFNEHFRGDKSNIILQKAFKKYGLHNFSLQILEYCDKSLLTEREQYYLSTLKPEYNLSPTADSSLGVKHSEETRKKMSLGRMGEKNHNFGKNLSPETLRKISEVKGITIYLYSLDLKLIECFPSSQKAGKYFGSNNSTILKNIRPYVGFQKKIYFIS